MNRGLTWTDLLEPLISEADRIRNHRLNEELLADAEPDEDIESTEERYGN